MDTQGDAFFFAFATAPDALAAAAALTKALDSGAVRVRTGLHTGTPLLTEEGYVGADVNRAARIAAAGHGGQVLVSSSTASLLGGDDGVRDLGEHRFKDLAAPERVYQLGGGSFPPLKSLYRTNLPVLATPFLGRERELVEVVELLSRDDLRVVTLTGPGGTGKTRLALQAAAEVSDRFPDGTWWVPLATLRDASAVTAQIAQSVDATSALAEHVADKRMLVLLDNLEHLLDAVPALAELVAACPNLVLLATSRELLLLRGEHAYAVPTLSDEDGTRLFVSRALAVGGDVSDEEAVAELCRRLDHLPLAVELAAARTRHLTPKGLLERLSQRLDLLEAGRDADPRQQTLRATIEWSHDLLDEDERGLFARLSVFAGGSTLDAAEAICGADVVMLGSLVDKSLLRRTGERFWMLETIREFATERLRSNGEESLRRRHAVFFTALAPSLGFTVESIEAGARQRHDVAVAELDNVRAAIEWAREVDPVLALRLASSLENFWISYSSEEGVRLFEDLVARAPDAPLELRALATRCRGNFELMSGNFEPGMAFYEASLELYGELGDEYGMAVIEHRLAVNFFTRGERQRARELLEASIARSREHGFRINGLMALGALGAFDYREGDVEHGLERLRTTLDAAREVGFKWWEANMRNALATYATELGRLEEAEEHAREQLVLARAMHDRRHVVQALGLLARLAADRGDADRAARLWGALEAEEARGPVGQRRPRMAAWDEERALFEEIVLAAAGGDFESERAEGRRMSLDDAVDYAVADA